MSEDAAAGTVETSRALQLARRNVVAMYGVDSFGTGAFTSAQIVFFTHMLSRSPEEISIALSSANLVALVVILPFGKLADRVNAGTLLALMNGAIGLFMLGYMLPTSLIGFFVTTSLVVLFQRLLGPIRAAAIAHLFPVTRTAVRAAAHVSFNVGFSLGSLLSAGLLLVIGNEGFRWLLLIDIATFGGCALIALRLPRTRPKPLEPEHRRSYAALRDRPFLVAAIANMFGSLHDAALFVGLPLWLLQRTNAPGWVVPAITALNCVLVVVLQVRLSRGTDTVRGAARTQWRGTLAMAGGCVLLVPTWGDMGVMSWAFLAGAVILLTFGEIAQSAGAWGLSYNLADERRVTEYQSLFGLSLNIQEVVGPILVTALVLSVPDGLGWLVLAGLALLPVGVATRLLHAWAPDEAPVAQREQTR